MKEHVFAICAYGDSPYLEACIRSLKMQTVPADIILCTSTPSPHIEGLAKSNGIPVFVREGKSNIRDDWEFACKMADARLVTIAHQDDMYHRQYKETLLKYARKYPDMTVFTTYYVLVKGRTVEKKDRVRRIKRLLRLPLIFPFLNHLRPVKKAALMLGNPVCCPSCTYNKELSGEPLFESCFQYALDWDTLTRLADQDGRFICVERPLLYYRIHEANATKACMKDERRSREETEMFSRFWPNPVVKGIMHFYRRAYKAYEG